MLRGIEVIRISHISIAPEDRICKFCNIHTETEEHCMLFCPKCRKLRLKLIRNISEIDASIYNIPYSSRFII